MEWCSVFHQLVSHNDDIRRLMEKGYAVSIDAGYLVVRDIPYLNEKGELQTGALVSKLVFVDQEHVELPRFRGHVTIEEGEETCHEAR